MPDPYDANLLRWEEGEFFPGMQEQDERLCLAHAQLVRVRRRELFAQPYETQHDVWLIRSGLVRLLRINRDGRALAVDLLGPGEVVGEIGLLTGQPMAEWAEAVEEALLCKLPASVLRSVCRSNVAVGMHVARRVALRRARIEARLADNVMNAVPVRIAKLLLNFAERFAEGPSSQPLLDVRLTHQAIADFAGCSREAATRAVDQLMERRLIGYDQGKIRILKVEDLAERAGDPS